MNSLPNPPTNGNSLVIPPQLRRLSIHDLIVMLFITTTGISNLRWRCPGILDQDLLRSELRSRELGVEAGQ